MNAWLTHLAWRGIALSFALAVFCLFPAAARAEYMMPDITKVPVDRLVANLQEKLDAIGTSGSGSMTAQEEAATRLNLARVHAMAYALKTESATVRVGQEERGAWFGHQPAYVPFSAKPTDDPKKEAAAKEHLEKAIREYARAVELDESNQVAALGHAWCIEQSGKKDEAVKLYRKLIEAAWETESALTRGRMGGHYITSEAAGYLIPLLDATKDAQEIATLGKRAEQLRNLRRIVTPIAVPLRGGMMLGDFVAPKARVQFDADGMGLGKSWSWIRPEAGWLVHDHRGDGRIDTALQLFGNVTFWLFWDNGYEAMSSLDDNRDGNLSGAELTGLAIWQDANENGQSDPGEVRPLADWGIESLSCRHRDFDGDPDCKVYSPEGVRFTDGTTRATYDVLLFERP